MSKVVKLTETDLNNLVKKILDEQLQEPANYMFFSNLEQIKRQCEKLLELDPHMKFFKTDMIGPMTMLLKLKQIWTKFLTF